MKNCKNNKFVLCDKQSPCSECGWNPTIAEERLQYIRKQGLQRRGFADKRLHIPDVRKARRKK